MKDIGDDTTTHKALNPEEADSSSEEPPAPPHLPTATDVRDYAQSSNLQIFMEVIFAGK